MNITGVSFFYLSLGGLIFLANGWLQEDVLDKEGNVKFYWTADVKKNVLLFEVQAKTTGYVGIGISPNGTMHNADIMVGYVDGNGEPHLSDYWAVKNGQLKEEESHDWKLLTGIENNSHTMLRVRRPLRPDDHFDMGIFVEPSWVIWAFHPNDPIIGQLPHYHEHRRGAKQLCLIEQDCFPKAPSSASTLISAINVDLGNGKFIYLLLLCSFWQICIFNWL